MFELLENILLHCTIDDLLVCELVSKMFMNVIDGSSQLKQALFRIPNKTGLVDLARAPKLLHDWQKDEFQTSATGLPILYKPLLNPFLQWKFDQSKQLIEQVKNTVLSKRLCPAVEKMFVTQPPTTRFVMYCGDCHFGQTGYFWTVCESGVTIEKFRVKI